MFSNREAFPDLNLGFLDQEILLFCLNVVFFNYYLSGNRENFDFLGFVAKEIFNLDLSFEISPDELEKEQSTDFVVFMAQLKQKTVENSQIQSISKFNYLVPNSDSPETSQGREVSWGDSMSIDSSLNFSSSSVTESKLTRVSNKENKSKWKVQPKERDSLLFTNRDLYGFIRIFYVFYERMLKIKQISDDSTKFTVFSFLLKAHIFKKLSSVSQFEDIIRQILGPDFFFLIHIDKTLSAITKSVSQLQNDSLTKEIRALKRTQDEAVYLAKFSKLKLCSIKQ